MKLPSQFSIQELTFWYKKKYFTPIDVFTEIGDRIEKHRSKNIWINVFDSKKIKQWLDKANPNGALYGIPFAIKDNIDLKGVMTTAGCEGFGYFPKKSAFVVEQLMLAGAIPIGKTNLDQFATGLVGTRSPYGACHHSSHLKSISGGSSSGSAVALALGMCAFSLGTDTAGSGRVPAALNKICGYKPTPGILSMHGVVPACLSLDTISIFYRHHSDMASLLPIITKKDSEDAFQINELNRDVLTVKPYATVNIDDVVWKGQGHYKQYFDRGLSSLRTQGFNIVEENCEVFFEVARLLYEGPWIAERYASVGKFIESHGKGVDPTVAQIILGAKDLKAVDAFNAMYLLSQKKKIIKEFFEKYSGLILPTIGGWFTRDEIEADPIGLNSYLGTFTNFANLLGLSACAFPVNLSAIESDPGFGLTLFQPGCEDLAVLENAHKMKDALDFIPIAVCGAHLKGEPLNYQLVDMGAIFRKVTRTLPNYAMVALSTLKPGMYRKEFDGDALEVEVWDVPKAKYGAFVNSIDAPLGVGKIELCDGELVTGFLVEPYVVSDFKDISRYGGWREYKNSI